MPTAYGALAQDKRAPTGKVQIKRGAVDGSVAVTSATAVGPMSDGAGGLMQISYTPTYPCLWLIRSNVMALGATDSQGWRRWDHLIYISPADFDGRNSGFQCPHQIYDQATISWRMCSGSYMFRLNAGIAYTASLYHAYLSKGTAYYHTGPLWSRIIGRIVGESAL